MDIIIICVIIAAVVFEFINGFHDTANAIATSVYTRALSVGAAIALAAVMNFIGAMLFSGVAATISTGLVESTEVVPYVLFAALIGAIIWGLFTWWRAMPSSSSHALIGSFVGAAIAYSAGIDSVIWSGVLTKVILPMFISPVAGFLLGYLLMKAISKVCARVARNKANKTFSKLQILSAAAMAFAHGTGDAQKTMGIITLALFTAGTWGVTDPTAVPLVVKAICAVTIAAGTAVGGWKIMKTVGGGVTKLEPAGGFAAQAASSAVILFATLFQGFHAPVSTTHIMTTSVMGVGSARRLKAVKWKIAKDIMFTWLITLPATMVLGAVCTLLLGAILSSFGMA